MSRNQFSCDCEIIHRDTVDLVLHQLPNRSTINALARLFKILGNPTRVKICLAINCHELCVCDLANVLSMTKSSISHQLRALRERHIVKARRSGKEIYYVLDDYHVKQVLELTLKHIKHNAQEKSCA